MAGTPAITSSSTSNSRGGGVSSGTTTTTTTTTSLSDDGSIGDAETVTMSNLSFRWNNNNTKVKPAAIPKQIVPPVVVPEVTSPMAQRQTVRKDLERLLSVIDHHFQYAFLNVLEQDLHRQMQRSGSVWRILLEAYLVVKIPNDDELDIIARRFYALNHDDAYHILSSLGHDSRVYI